MTTTPFRLPSTVKSSAIQAKDLDLVAHIIQACERVESLEPDIHALVPESGRLSRLLGEADSLQQRCGNLEAIPPLYGMLVGVKDVFHVNGLPTQAGSRLPAEIFSSPESAVVSKLRSAGSIFLGKTAMDEFAHADPAPTRNPHNILYTPGGSSGGSAAAVAAGYCSVAISTQTTGSTVVPASFCGVTGFAATHGRVEMGEIVSLSPSLDTFGALAIDIATTNSIVAPLLTERRNPAEAPPSLMVPEELAGYLDPEVLGLFKKSVNRLSTHGLKVESVALGSVMNLPRVYEQTQVLMFGEMARQHASWFRDHSANYGEAAAQAVRAGQKVSDSALQAASALKSAVMEDLLRLMETRQIGAWILPTYAGPVPKIGESKQVPSMALLWAFAAMPMVSLPAGSTENGLPFGILLAGMHMHDEELLHLAAVIEKSLQQGIDGAQGTDALSS